MQSDEKGLIQLIRSVVIIIAISKVDMEILDLWKVY